MRVEEVADKQLKYYNNHDLEVIRRHAEVVNRIVIGNQVIDHEVITEPSSEETKKAVAVYDIDGDQIRKVWFLVE